MTRQNLISNKLKMIKLALLREKEGDVQFQSLPRTPFALTKGY